MNTMHIEDFIVLSRTVPEESKKYGKRVCMAGFSPSNRQFLRVYPLMLPIGEHVGTNSFGARYQYAMDLQRNPNDNRTESWRVVDETKPTLTRWDEAKEIKKNDLIKMLAQLVVPSIKHLNDSRASLGVIHLKADQWEGVSELKDEPEHKEENKSLFEDIEYQLSQRHGPKFDPTNVKFVPRVRFKDAAGKHFLQVREWGAWLLMGKPEYRDDPEVLWNAGGYMRGKDTLFVVGNMMNFRNNWMVLKFFQFDKKTDTSLFG